MKISEYIRCSTPRYNNFALKKTYFTAAWSVSWLLMLSVGVARGQDSSDFALFEALDSDSRVGPERNRQRRSNSGTEVSASTPEFSLIGTSRIGSRMSIILRHASGDKVHVPIERRRTSIPGYEQFAVIGSEPGSVLIQYPESVFCSDFGALGVSCDTAENIATLTLSPVRIAEQGNKQIEAIEEGESSASVNPFEALRNRTEKGDIKPDQTNRFQPRRISPGDVPPGMRVVSTPFGDRLVEE